MCLLTNATVHWSKVCISTSYQGSATGINNSFEFKLKEHICLEGAGSLPTLYCPYSPITYIWNFLPDGSQWFSFINRIWQHCWNISSIEHVMVNVQVVPFIPIWMKYSSVPIPRDLCPYMGSLQTEIKLYMHWLGFLSYRSMPFSNHKPRPKTEITIFIIPKVYAVPAEHIGVLICSGYSSKNGDAVHCWYI